MMMHKQKKNQGNRILIGVTVLGSAGPIRFIVNEEQRIGVVIETALKSYAREGRLPVLGSRLDDFMLCCSNAGSDALNPWERIGSLQGARNFTMWKKPQADGHKSLDVKTVRKGTRTLKSWINKSLKLKISSH